MSAYLSDFQLRPRLEAYKLLVENYLKTRNKIVSISFNLHQVFLQASSVSFITFSICYTCAKRVRNRMIEASLRFRTLLL